MTDAEYFKNVIELQRERYHPVTNTGCTNVMTSRLERAIKDLERLEHIKKLVAEIDLTPADHRTYVHDSVECQCIDAVNELQKLLGDK